MTAGSLRERLGLKLALCCAVGLVAGLLFAASAAAAPGNDDFANAQAISGPSTTVSGTNVGANKQTGEPDHAGDPGGASVWYSWTAPSSGTVQLDTCSASFDTLLAVYTGSPVGSLHEVASNDQGAACGDQSKLHFQAVNGTTYRIAVDGYSDFGFQPADTGTFQLHLQVVTPPANNDFANGEDVPFGTENNVTGTNLAATKQANEPNHAGDPGGASVWYRWTAPLTGTVRFNTCDSDFDTVVAVYTGSSLSALTPVASNHNNCPGLGSVVTVPTVLGTEYLIAVDGFSDGGSQPPEQGEFVLHEHGLSRPFNDDFAHPRLILGGTQTLPGSNVDATAEGGEPSGFPGGPLYSVWYFWTPPASGLVSLNTCDSDFDTVLSVFTGSSLGGLTRIASNDDAIGCGAFDLGSKLLLNVSGGTTYRIAVDGYLEEGDFQLALGFAPGPTVAQKDSKPPKSKITKLIVDSAHHKATIKFASSETGGNFRCKLDHKAWRSCHSPKTYRHLADGKHKVRVQARDAAGNLDPSAAVRKFKIAG